MRKFLFACVAVFGLTNITAQEKETVGGFEKGDAYITGTVSFLSRNDVNLNNGVESEFTGVLFRPSAGYFVSENIAFELGLIYSLIDREDDFGGGLENTEISSFGVVIGADYFFTPSNRFSLFAGTRFSYQSEKTKSPFSNDFNEDTFIFSLRPGVNYFISKSFALRVSAGALSYAVSSPDIEGIGTSRNFSFDLDLSNINIGLTYKF